MDKAVHKAVRARAGHRCEYCRFPEAFAELPFHLDHIIALQHEGPSVPENLALACCYCNRYKGPNLSGIDPESGHVVSLFHPRQQLAWDGARLLAKSTAARRPFICCRSTALTQWRYAVYSYRKVYSTQT